MKHRKSRDPVPDMWKCGCDKGGRGCRNPNVWWCLRLLCNAGQPLFFLTGSGVVDEQGRVQGLALIHRNGSQCFMAAKYAIDGSPEGWVFCESAVVRGKSRERRWTKRAKNEMLQWPALPWDRRNRTKINYKFRSCLSKVRSCSIQTAGDFWSWSASKWRGSWSHSSHGAWVIERKKKIRNIRKKITKGGWGRLKFILGNKDLSSRTSFKLDYFALLDY